MQERLQDFSPEPRGDAMMHRVFFLKFRLKKLYKKILRIKPILNTLVKSKLAKFQQFL